MSTAPAGAWSPAARRGAVRGVEIIRYLSRDLNLNLEGIRTRKHRSSADNFEKRKNLTAPSGMHASNQPGSNWDLEILKSLNPTRLDYPETNYHPISDG